MLINFDFDGVIADTLDRLLTLCISAQESVAAGRPPVKQDFQTIENLTFVGLADHLEIPQELVPHFLQTCFDLQQKEQRTVRFFPGMVSLLKNLSVSSDIAIITSSSAELVRGSLNEHGVLESVSSICGGDKGHSKRDTILTNIEQFSVSPRQTCMVGDAISDIRQGKAAEVLTIGVGWGFQTCELLLQEAPDHLANSPEELVEILRKLGF